MDPVIALRNTYSCLTREAATGNVKAQAKLGVFTDAMKRFATDSSTEYVHFVKNGLNALKAPSTRHTKAHFVSSFKALGFSDEAAKEDAKAIADGRKLAFYSRAAGLTSDLTV